MIKPPIFVALDVDDQEAAFNIASQTKEYVGGYKIGPRLLNRYGSDLISKLSEIKPVFVDCKFHDITNTVLAALKSVREAGASYATVHAANGPKALKAIAEYEKESGLKVLGVTVITSLDDESLPSNWKQQSISQHVLDLAQDVFNSGLSGLVCSAHEVKQMRELNSEAFLLTPGIRLPDSDLEDQKRVMTPNEALVRGATALVVGRPIVNAKDPRVAAKNYFESI